VRICEQQMLRHIRARKRKTERERDIDKERKTEFTILITLLQFIYSGLRTST